MNRGRLAFAATGSLLVVAVMGGSLASAGGTATQYAIGQPVCLAKKHSKTAEITCDALRRVVVSKGTKGARPFTPGAGATASGTIGPAGGLTPGDLASAYNLTTTGGSGQTIAIVDAYNDPNIEADLATFDSNYGLSSCTVANTCLKIVNQTGGSTPPTNDTAGWSVEETLDVESAHSVCQGCSIVLIEANSPSTSDLATAENEAVTLGATVVSNSFGEPESGTSSGFASAFDHPGVAIVASAGDDGYYDYDKLASVSQPQIPAAYPTVIAVGGTSLYLDQSGARQSETVWNDNGPQDYWQQNFGVPLHAGGGGCSTLFAAPGWQTSQSVWSSTGCGSHRLVSDVSAVGDYLTGLDIYDSYDCGGSCTTGWSTVGGTSLAAPVIAATWGLAGGAHGISYPALTMYGHPNGGNDVRAGGNGWCDGMGAAQCTDPNLFGDGVLDCAYTPGGAVAVGDRACDALAGFDGPTGLGTPNGTKLFVKLTPTVSIGGPTTVTHGVSNMWTPTVTDPFPGGSITTYTWHWGDGTPNTVNSTGAASHTYSTAGSRTITLTVTDNYGVTGTKTLGVTVS